MQPYLACKYSVARYKRLRDADFAAADNYYSAIAPITEPVVAKPAIDVRFVRDDVVQALGVAGRRPDFD